MKKTITFISDTHTKHKYVTSELPGGDILIHCGDISSRGYMTEIKNFLEWFDGVKGYEHKIFIAGNHDFGFQDNPKECAKLLQDYPTITYLEDTSVIIDGIKIYGSPWQPRFYDWAFNVDRGEAIAKKWEKIPQDTDILITHGPVFGILDKTYTGQVVGCEELYKKVMEVKPKVHACGHIHYARHIKQVEDIVFVNACCLGEDYLYQNGPITVEYDFENTQWELLAH
jgi:Icc-related predicted phosphoesterase